MKKWYFKLDENNVILDVIEYPFEDYIEVQLSAIQLPSGINGGWFKLEDNKIVEYSELKPINEEDRMSRLENAVVDLTEIILGGI